MKILFTCVGRRVELIESFKKAAKKLHIKLEIFGTDIDETAPALYFCDKTFLISSINSEKYINELFEICKFHKIDAVIPTIDTDLIALSKNKNKFSKIKTKIILSDESFIINCRNKELTNTMLRRCKLKVPNFASDYKKYKDGFPAFIRPKDGSSSINAFEINNFNELKFYANKIKNYIVTRYINGIEYTVDVFCDFKGNPILITPRIRLAVRSGEVLKTKIDYDSSIIKEVKTIINRFKPIGAITIQLIKEKNNNYYIEINPRFGGGAPISIKAGADSSKFILKLLKGETVGFQSKSAIDGSIWSRYDQSIRIK